MLAWAIWVPVISAGIGGLIAIIGNVLNKRAEEKKQLKEATKRSYIKGGNRELARPRRKAEQGRWYFNANRIVHNAYGNPL